MSKGPECDCRCNTTNQWNRRINVYIYLAIWITRGSRFRLVESVGLWVYRLGWKVVYVSCCTDIYRVHGRAAQAAAIVPATPAPNGVITEGTPANQLQIPPQTIKWIFQDWNRYEPNGVVMHPRLGICFNKRLPQILSICSGCDIKTASQLADLIVDSLGTSWVCMSLPVLYLLPWRRGRKWVEITETCHYIFLFCQWVHPVMLMGCFIESIDIPVCCNESLQLQEALNQTVLKLVHSGSVFKDVISCTNLKMGTENLVFDLWESLLMFMSPLLGRLPGVIAVCMGRVLHHLLLVRGFGHRRNADEKTQLFVSKIKNDTGDCFWAI